MFLLNFLFPEFISSNGSVSILRISPVGRQHGGRYQCLVRNLIGEQTSKLVQVEVFCK